jgi:hypothetical protein
MPGFEIHLLSGAVGALLLQNHPIAALALLIGSVFPDIDSKTSVPRRWIIFGLGIFLMVILYPLGLLTSITLTLLLLGLFVLLLPKHRKWMHKIQGQLLFATFCLLITSDFLVMFAAIIGTTLHRILDLV